MSLLLTLRNTTTGLSAEELVASVPGYGLADPSTNPLSARRKFERDKDTLRELGIEVTTTGRPDEPRYRIDDEEYTLPALHLSAEQAACLSLAASAWRDGNLPATARRALTKLRAVSEGPTGSSSAGLPFLTADLSGDEIPEELITAVDERRLVTFDYVSARSGSTRARTVEPHHLRLAEGAWYLDAVEPTGTHRETPALFVAGIIWVRTRVPAPRIVRSMRVSPSSIDRRASSSGSGLGGILLLLHPFDRD